MATVVTLNIREDEEMKRLGFVWIRAINVCSPLERGVGIIFHSWGWRIMFYWWHLCIGGYSGDIEH